MACPPTTCWAPLGPPNPHHALCLSRLRLTGDRDRMDGWVGGWDQEPAGWQEWPLPDCFFSIPPPPTDPCPHVWGKRTETSMIRRGGGGGGVGRYPVLGHSLWFPQSTVRLDESWPKSRRCRGRGSRYAHSNSGPGLHGAHHPGGQVPSGPRYLGRYGVPRWAPLSVSSVHPPLRVCRAARRRVVGPQR